MPANTSRPGCVKPLLILIAFLAACYGLEMLRV